MSQRVTPDFPPSPDEISFSFGENWLDFLPTIDDNIRAAAVADLERWLGPGEIAGRSVVDVGSGSGLSSLAFREAGCATLTSIDVDPKSVEATTNLADANTTFRRGWTILNASVLDDNVVAELGQFDIVYSWGVLHHTGAMWQALGNACRLCRDGGKLWISIYQGGPRYDDHLALKRRYNAADDSAKQQMVAEMAADISGGKDSLSIRNERGMNVYHDVIDWLGGLPYEVARPSEILSYCEVKGFSPLEVMEVPEGGCSIYTFVKTSMPREEARFLYSTSASHAPTHRTTREQASAELRNSDAALNRATAALEARAAVAERRVAELEGQLNSGTHLSRALLRRLARGFSKG